MKILILFISTLFASCYGGHKSPISEVVLIDKPLKDYTLVVRSLETDFIKSFSMGENVYYRVKIGDTLLFENSGIYITFLGVK